MDLAHGLPQIIAEALKVTGNRSLGTTYQNIVPAIARCCRQNRPYNSPQAALGPIPPDRVTDFLRTGVADAIWRRIPALFRLQQQAGGRISPCGGGTQKIRPVLNDGRMSTYRRSISTIA